MCARLPIGVATANSPRCKYASALFPSQSRHVLCSANTPTDVDGVAATSHYPLKCSTYGCIHNIHRRDWHCSPGRQLVQPANALHTSTPPWHPHERPVDAIALPNARTCHQTHTTTNPKWGDSRERRRADTAASAPTAAVT